MQKMHKTPTPVAASHERVSDASGRVWESMKSLSTGRVLNVTTDPETGVETLHKYVWPFKNKKTAFSPGGDLRPSRDASFLTSLRNPLGISFNQGVFRN